MLLKTKYWRYFVRLCVNTGFDISTLQNMISSLEVGGEKRVGDYSFKLISKDKESFGTVYRIEVYSYAHNNRTTCNDYGAGVEEEEGGGEEGGETKTSRPCLILKCPVLLYLPPRMHG